jgi:hypothetical protein
VLDGTNHYLPYCYQHNGMDSNEYNIKLPYTFLFVCLFTSVRLVTYVTAKQSNIRYIMGIEVVVSGECFNTIVRTEINI